MTAKDSHKLRNELQQILIAYQLQQAAPCLPLEQALLESTPNFPALAGLKVLIAEDNEVTLSFVANAVTGGGMSLVGQATTADELFNLAKQHRPQLIVLDLNLGTQMDGLEAMTRLARMDILIPVIVLTGYPDPHHTHRYPHVNVIGMMNKPLDTVQVVNLINFSWHRHLTLHQLTEASESLASEMARNSLIKRAKKKLMGEYPGLQEAQAHRLLLEMAMNNSKRAEVAAQMYLDGHIKP